MKKMGTFHQFVGWELSKNVDFYIDLLETSPFPPGAPDQLFRCSVVNYASRKIRSDERLQAALESAKSARLAEIAAEQ